MISISKMIELQLIGVGCNKSWKMEDVLIKLSREMGIPLQITKIMDLDSIITLGLSTIPVLMYHDRIWTYEEIMRNGTVRQILIELNDLEHPKAHFQ